MSTAVKIAGFTAFFRLVMTGGAHAFSSGALAWLAIATMIIGNVGALAQTSVKRMMAYSSIGHAGYLLLGPVAWSAGSPQALEATLFYLAAYSLTNLAAFGVLSFVETREGGAQRAADRFFVAGGQVLGQTFREGVEPRGRRRDRLAQATHPKPDQERPGDVDAQRVVPQRIEDHLAIGERRVVSRRRTARCGP